MNTIKSLLLAACLTLTTLGMRYNKGLGENNLKTLGLSASVTDINLSWHNYATIYNASINLKLPRPGNGKVGGFFREIWKSGFNFFVKDP